MADPTSTSSEVRARILIVDDHPNTVSTLARILERPHLPVEILTALNGQEALALIGEGVDVLIVDYLMPGMSGLDLIKHLRAQPIRQPAGIVLITAHHSAELVALGQQLQIDDYLVKPVPPERIRELVEQILQRPRPVCATGTREPDGANATGASAFTH
jgi:CheY-like chemotaxis protein